MTTLKTRAKKRKGMGVWPDSCIFGLFFLACTCVACIPVLLHPTYHIGDIPVGDKGTNLWNLWWVYYALITLHQSPLWSDLIFYPQGCDLRFHTLSLSNGLIALPLTAFVGPVVAYNVLFFLWTWLTGVFASLWARTFYLSRIAAAFIGFLAAFGPYRWSHIIHLNLFSTAFLFLGFYVFETFFLTRKNRYLVWFGLCWGIVAWTDWYYAIFTGMYFCLRWLSFMLVTPRSRERTKTILLGLIPLCFALFFAVVYFSPWYSPPVPTRVIDTVDVQYSIFWSMDILQIVFPPWILDQWGYVFAYGSEFLLHPGFMIFMFIAATFFSSTGQQESKEARLFLLVGACFFLLFSLGPVLKIAGTVSLGGFPFFLPAFVMEWIPYLTSIRVFSRFAYLGFLFLVAWSCLRFSTNKINTQKVSLILYSSLAIAMLLETGFSFPYMVKERPNDQILNLPAGPVLNIPYEPTSLSGLYLYQQTSHHQPLFVTEFSRLSQYKKDYLQKYIFLHRLHEYWLAEENRSDISMNGTFCQELMKSGIRTMIFLNGKSDVANQAKKDYIEQKCKECLKEIEIKTTRVDEIFNNFH
jgi:hypothetical protein